jgi:hypothetical protein
LGNDVMFAVSRITGNSRVGISHRIHRALKRLHEAVLDGDQEAGHSVVLVIPDRAVHDLLNNNIEIGNYRGHLTASIV